jgi:hypothetical protein
MHSSDYRREKGDEKLMTDNSLNIFKVMSFNIDGIKFKNKKKT